MKKLEWTSGIGGYVAIDEPNTGNPIVDIEDFLGHPGLASEDQLASEEELQKLAKMLEAAAIDGSDPDGYILGRLTRTPFHSYPIIFVKLT